MNRRVKPVASQPKLIPSILAISCATIAFAILMVRLEVTEEGYRLSNLHAEIAKQQEENRRLRLEAAELSSQQRLRALAGTFHLVAPQHGQVVMVP